MKLEITDIKDIDFKSMKNQPGNYRWWVKEEDVIILLGHYFYDLKNILTKTSIDNNILFLIYTGESLGLKERIRGYLRGTGSFANTISSLGNGAVKFTDFYIEYEHYLGDRPGPTISKKESDDLYNNNIPLNLQSNEQLHFKELHQYIAEQRKLNKDN